MADYCEISITAPESMHDVLVAELSLLGYEGFEQTETAVKAYLTEADFDSIDLNNLLNKYSLSYSKSIIEMKNWNEVWESNFEPVQVDDFVGIRADFHPSFSNVVHEIVITPKMSFGTGHHATTYMVMKLMQGMDFAGKTVFDFGTGTGILAILAEKLGAGKVTAVDNDDWCIENASENTSINNCKVIDIQKSDKMNDNVLYDVILANINRNIILDNLAALGKSLNTNGQLILSGLLKEDETDIINACDMIGLRHNATLDRNGWIALWFF